MSCPFPTGILSLGLTINLHTEYDNGVTVTETDILALDEDTAILGGLLAGISLGEATGEDVELTVTSQGDIPVKLKWQHFVIDPVTFDVTTTDEEEILAAGGSYTWGPNTTQSGDISITANRLV